MFGERKKIELRDIWKSEPADFTPWLADNIDKLGQAIGMELEFKEKEASVGDFSLDILAKDLATGKEVVIENQLTKTDHDHLGKLLTYASGFDASTIIWLFDSIRDEHRITLEWLNKISNKDTSFFGVMMEVIQIDDSKPSYNFNIVTSPNKWQKNKLFRNNKKSNSPRSEKYRNYFQSLIDELRQTHKFTSMKSAQGQSFCSFASGHTGISYGANFAQNNKSRTELYIDVGNQIKNKRIFELLQEDKTLIESELNENLVWERLDDKQASRIALYTESNINDTDLQLADTQDWHIDKLLKFKSVLSGKIKSAVQVASSVS